MQQWEDDLLLSLRRPLAFAADDDEEDEEDIFTEEGLAEDEPEEEPAASGGGGGGGEEASGDFKRPLVASILFTVIGLLTPVLLVLAHQRLGALAWPAFLMLIFSGMGALAAIVNLVYNLTKGKQYAVAFQLRSFFRWHELAAICAILLPLAVANLAAVPEGHQLTLRRGEPGYSMIAMFKALPHAVKGTSEKGPELPPPPPEATGKAFLGGALWGALGYAMALGLAGCLFAAFRPINSPFSAKVQETVNEETGETTTTIVEPGLPLKIAGIPFRMLVGYSAGTTIGLVFGVVVILLTWLLFLRHDALDPTLQSLLAALGSSRQPDMAFSGGFTVAALIVPLAFLLVGKLSPPGKSLSEGEIKARYVAPITARGLSPVELPAPAMISFGDMGPDPEEDLLADVHLDASLTNELLDEFGQDLETVFGIEALAKTEEEIVAKKVTLERSQVAAIVQQSFGELGQIQVEVAAELGRASIALSEWLHLREGTLVELNQPVGDSIDLVFNGVLKGHGRLAVVDNHIGVHVTQLNLNGEGPVLPVPVEEETRVERRT